MPEERKEAEKKPESRNPQNKKTPENPSQKKKDHRKLHQKKKPKPPVTGSPSKEGGALPAPLPAPTVAPTLQKPSEKKEMKRPVDKRPQNAPRSSSKAIEAKPVEQKSAFYGIEIGEPRNTTDWLEEDIGRYHRAVIAALSKSPVSPEGILDLSEIWISTSLPLDLIIEVIQTQGLEGNLQEVRSIVFQGRKIWPLPKQVGKED
ncbi:MAG: hypothetical protein WBK65_04435 [Thermotogota bacterium]